MAFLPELLQVGRSLKREQKAYNDW